MKVLCSKTFRHGYDIVTGKGRLLNAAVFTVGSVLAISVSAASAAGASQASEVQQNLRQQAITIAHNGMAPKHWGKRHHRRHIWRHLMQQLDLTDAQRDQIFKLRHAAAPELRQHRMAVRAARRELNGLSFSDAYSEEKATRLAQELASARAQVARLRARSAHQMYKVLNAKQRAKLLEQLRQRRRV